MKKKMLSIAALDPEIRKDLEKEYDIFQHPRWQDNSIAEEELTDILVKAAPEVLVLEAQALTRKVLEKVPSLKMVASVRTTPANIDLDCCRERGILVSTSPGRNAVAVVEMTIAFMINCARMFPQAYYDIRTRAITLPVGTPPRETKDILWEHPTFEKPPYIKYSGREITGKTMGMVGFGAIAKMIVPKAKVFDMRVLTYDPYVDAATAAAHGVKKVSLEELLAESDYVSLHTKVTAETRHMIGLKQIKLMKPTAYLINTARGGLINQPELVQALRERVIAGAAIDVYESEPLFSDSPLLELDNLFMTPHIGGATQDVIRHQSELVQGNVMAYATGKPLPHQVK